MRNSSFYRRSRGPDALLTVSGTIASMLDWHEARGGVA